MVIRPKKELALSLVKQMAPQYLEFFREMQKSDGWRTLAERFSDIRKRLKLDSYVRLYGNEIWVYNALNIAFMGVEGLKLIAAKLSVASREEQQCFLDDLAADVIQDDTWLDEMFPESPEIQKAQLAAFEALPEDERAEAILRAQHLFAFVFASFYSCISVMVHGEKLTSLVPKAIAGDRNAFLKAVHIDKSILHAHPEFLTQYEQALNNQDQDFLRNIGYRVEASPTRGRIRFPGVYMVFALLESLGWLNDVRHEEILDLCDDAGLDRWQNRIEDVNYLTKRLGEYRDMQKRGGLSMP